MQSRMKVQIVPPSLELRVTGKVTRPSVAVTDPEFDITKYQRQDIPATIAKAKLRLRGAA